MEPVKAIGKTANSSSCIHFMPSFYLTQENMWHSIEVKVGFGIWVVETCVNIKGKLSENDIGAEASTSYSMYIYI